MKCFQLQRDAKSFLFQSCTKSNYMPSTNAKKTNIIIENKFKIFLEKGTTLKVDHTSGEFLSNMNLVQKTYGRNRPVTDLKYLNE